MSGAGGGSPGPRLAALASLAEPPEADGSPGEVAALPALRWLAGELAPRRSARVGLGAGAAAAALARAGSGEVLAAPWGEGEPGGGVRRLAGRVRLVEGVGVARAEAGDGTLDLLSLAHGAAEALGEWAATVAPGGAVALDAPEPGAALAALRAAFGPSVPTAALGGVAVALPGSEPPARLASLLAGPDAAATDALLGCLGAGLAARAGAAPRPSPGFAEAGPGAGEDDALRRLRDLAEERAREATRARAETLAALRAAEAASREADGAARLRAEEDAGIRAATAERERALHRAAERIAALEAEAEALRGRLAERFEEIALLTRERLEREGAS